MLVKQLKSDNCDAGAGLRAARLIKSEASQGPARFARPGAGDQKAS